MLDSSLRALVAALPIAEEDRVRVLDPPVVVELSVESLQVEEIQNTKLLAFVLVKLGKS